jgi:hypothetical protein
MRIDSGWVEAFAYAWIIALLNCVYAAGHHYGVHPTAFILLSFLFGGVALVLIAGPGERPWRIALVPQTWAYGALVIGTEVFYYLMLAYVPPADASIFVRFNVPLSVALGWLLLGRMVSGVRAWGVLGVTAAILATLWWLPHTQSAPFLLFAAATALAMSGRNFAAELHPWNRAARGVVEKMRVTGLVVLTTSLMGIEIAAWTAWLVAEGVLARSALVPALADFLAPQTLLLALAMGALLITAMQYLMFSSVVKITSESFFAVLALSPLFTLVLQEAAGWAGIAGIPAGGWYILPFLLLILAANALIVWRGPGSARR